MDFSVICALKIDIDKMTAEADDNFCKIYFGYTKQRKKLLYGYIRKTLHDKFYEQYTHKIIKLHSLHLTELPQGMECSHLCHNSLCQNPDHINVEPKQVNLMRKNCNNEKRCLDNHEYLGQKWPKCLL